MSATPFHGKIGLALSGGGFRATLYHLGLVRFLFDAGILPSVSHITSVSGGSIIAAHLALNWQRYTASPQEFDAAAAELIAFTRLDVRNRILRRFPLGFAVRPLRALVGRRNRKLTRTGLLEYHYEGYLFGDRSLFELPKTPELHILATNLSEGRLCSFNRQGLWMIRREPDKGFHIDRISTSLATVSMAVAASSAFPGFFPPMFLTEDDVGATSGAFGQHAFTDGGVFDNLGVRMFRFLASSTAQERRPWDGVLVSDTGKPFQAQASAEDVGVVRTAMRASDILMDRVWQLETETFRDAPGFAFARITDIIEEDEDPTALHPEVQRQMSSIRTDLDRFSPLEIASLIRHGYCVGRKACRTLLRGSADALPANPPWTPALRDSAATAADEPEAGTPEAPRQPAAVTRDARTLHASAVRRVWSRLFDFRDWTSYVYVPIILPILILTPYFSIKYYEKNHRLGQIVRSIAQSSKDLEQMGRLLEGPVPRFAGARAEDLPADDRRGGAGFTILQDLRMFDLRAWKPAGVGSPDSYIYGYRRMKVRRDPTNIFNQEFRVNVKALSADTQIRFPVQELRPKLYGRSAGVSPDGKNLMQWVVGLDFHAVPSDESAEIVYEQISPGLFLREGIGSVTLAFDIDTETVELSRWLLMPKGREFSRYLLTRYRVGNPDLPEKVKVTTEYVPEDRSILAFKLLGLDPGYTYELTWFYK